MTTEPTLLLALDLTGTFVFGLNGALTAVRAARLDVVGIVSLGLITAIGGGVIRDVCIGSIPPATFRDWRYFALGVGGGLIAFALSRRLDRLESPITVFDAVGLSVFAVIGAAKAVDFGLGIGPALLLGVVTGVGGGTIRDTLVGQIPTVLRSELYAMSTSGARGTTLTEPKVREFPDRARQPARLDSRATRASRMPAVNVRRCGATPGNGPEPAGPRPMWGWRQACGSVRRSRATRR